MAKEILLMDECVFKLDNAAGTLTDYSDDIISVTLTKNIVRGQFTTINSKTPSNTLDVPYNWQVTLEFVASKTDSAGLKAALFTWHTGTDNLRSIEAYDDDESTGSYKYSGEVALTGLGNSINKRGGSGDPETQSITLRGDGNLTIAVVT